MTSPIKSQPWIHSWYGDILAFHLIPLSFVLLAMLNLPPFQTPQVSGTAILVLTVLIIDWAHIFAQWHRIYSNPLESRSAKIRFTLSYPITIFLMAIYLHFGHQPYVDIVLIYFVIFHFIKQQFGIIRIYSKIDGPKKKFEARVETCLIYLIMWTPVIYWHITFPKEDFYWPMYFLNIPFIDLIFYGASTLYFGCAIIYMFSEILRWKRNEIINVPKNIALLAAALGWGGVSLFSNVPLLIFFSVVLTHDVSYLAIVWFTGRRDEKIMRKKVNWLSWWSLPGLIFYVGVLILSSHFIMVVHNRLARNSQKADFIFGHLLDGLPTEPRVWVTLGWALFFATQAHHYFIDRYLWKKEKDLAYMVGTGKFKLSENNE